MRLLQKLKVKLGQTNRQAEKRNPGLGLFVLLLSLTPFLMNGSLFQFGQAKSIPAEYFFDPLRFQSLTYENIQQIRDNMLPGPSPRAPEVKLPKKGRQYIENLFGKRAEAVCLMNVPPPKNFFDIPSVVKHTAIKQIERACRPYRKALNIYKRELAVFNKKVSSQKEDVRARARRLKEQADTFINSTHNKPFEKGIQAQITRYSQTYFDNVMAYVGVIGDAQEDADNEDRASLDTGNASLISSTQLLLLPAWLIGLLLIMPALGLCIKQRAWGLLLFGLSVPAYNYTIYVADFVLFDSNLLMYQINHVFAAQIALLWFVIFGHIRSRPFGYFILLSLLASLCVFGMDRLYILNVYTANIYEIQSQFSDALVALLIFVIATATARLVVEAIKENTELFKQMRFFDLIKNLSYALLLWIPMALLCLPFFYYTQYAVPKNTVTTLYNNNILIHDYTYPDGILDNALISTAVLSDDANFAWHLVIEERIAYLHATDKTLQKIDLAATMGKHFDNVVPRSISISHTKSKAWLIGPLVDIANKEMIKSIENSYANFRQTLRRQLLDALSEHQTFIKNEASTQVNEVTAKLESTRLKGLNIILDTNTKAQSMIFASFNTIAFYHMLAMFVFAYICVKSYLYVFSRVCFNQQTGLSISLLSDRRKVRSLQNLSRPHQPSIRACGSQYVIEDTASDTYYISRRFLCRGRAPKLSFVQMLGAPIARLLHKAYFMNAIKMTLGDDKVTCSSTQGTEYFEWELDKGQSVIFDARNFVGITQSVKLGTLVSPKISSLLLGRLFYSQATGPGKLILMTKGRAQICSSHHAINDIGSLPPELMVAMSIDSLLFIDSELDVLNLYMSSAYIKPASGDMIVDVDTQTGAKSGISSFIRHFILPG